ncbi:hypothetical protein GCAAIG_04140 [Candidatus Electronema halotolerans]
MDSNLIFSDPKMREEFLDRFDDLRNEFLARTPLSEDEKKELEAHTKDDADKAVKIVKEGLSTPVSKVLEAIIIRYGRPAYFVQNDSFNTDNTPSTADKVDQTVNKDRAVIEKAIPSVGRINLRNHRMPWVGTGWVVAENVLVTNRHVAAEFARERNGNFVFVGNTKASLDTVQEYDAGGREKMYRLQKVLWIAPPDGEHDVAFLSIDKKSNYDDHPQPTPIELMDQKAFAALSVKHWIAVIGYPALSPYNDHADQQRIFDGVFNVKRMQPGQIMAIPRGMSAVEHDATTLGGNSGSVVLDLETGKALALHFGGIEGKSNSAVAAPVVSELLDKHIFGLRRQVFPVTTPPSQDSKGESPSCQESCAVSTGGTATWKIPLEVSVTVGTPAMVSADAGTSTAPSAPKTSAASLKASTAIKEGLFGKRSPDFSLDELREMFSLSALTENEFNWNTALSLAVASELAYRSKSVVERTAAEWGLSACRFIDQEETQCFIASHEGSVLVSFRGSESLGDWLANMNVFTVKREYGDVHEGFYNGFADVREMLEEELERRSPDQVLLTGHSLGGALATIAAAEWNDKYTIGSVYTFGQPAVGKEDFEEFFRSKFFRTNYSDKFFRFVNDDDMVTRLPPLYRHLEKLYHFDTGSELTTRTESVSGMAATTGEPKMMSEKEFTNLQLLMRRTGRGDAAIITESVDRPVLEGFFPSVSDHSLNEYIRKIKSRISAS